ncbi:Asp23/Gls24 family envelope stress response protein [Alkaliphilus metalliredigens]|uniref:Asp23/Gls24 family envelope stress response protein n=1 Tax=Alkaliphilus metalliredigens TaxID=208226 RepID=UPI0002FB7BA4|nr:Asp23/Gls24 family envelope stress response protein [Alkaliphilus metalliredigens]
MEVTGEHGKIRIANDVIMLIAQEAVGEVKGIVSLSGGLPVGITEMFSKKTSSKKGVKIQNQETQVVINLAVVVEYGVIIPEVIRLVQEKVKRSIEAMTDIEVGRVNVFVQDIRI